MTETTATRLREIVREYACHVHWRCEHQDRWPWDDDCLCGLVKACREAGLPARVAINAPIAR